MPKTTFRAFILCVVVGVSLAACGGGGGGGSTQTFTTSFGYMSILGATSTSPVYRAYNSGSPVSGLASGENFVITSGSLPPGLSLDAGTGIVAGVPTSPGAYSAGITLTRSGYTGSATANIALTVEDLTFYPSPLTYKSGSILSQSFGALFGGGTPVYSDPSNGVVVIYSMAPGSVLPTGVSLNPATGVIVNGSSLAAGSYSNIQFEATVSYQGVTHTYVSPVQTIVVTP